MEASPRKVSRSNDEEPIASLPQSKLQSPQKNPARTGISARSILIGLIGVILTCYLVSYAELFVAKMQIGTLQFPPVVIGGFFILILINRPLRGISPRLSLNPQELMTIYCMALIATMVASRGMVERIVPTMVGVRYLADDTNRWTHLFFPYIKKWMVAFDPSGPDKQKVVTLFYEGIQHGEKIPWAAWVIPLINWGGLLFLSFFGLMCLASILRRQWVDHEKLTFPLVQLPLEMAKETPVFRNRLTAIGFAIPATIFMMNGLHGLWPNVPQIAVSIILNDFLQNSPWNAMPGTIMYLSFAAVGFFYFLPSDLLFSLWFFFILTRLEVIFAASYGIVPDVMTNFPTHRFIAYQTIGAFLVLAGYYLMIGWPQFKKVIASAVHHTPIDDDHEWIPYRLAFWGIPISILGMALWCWLMGMSLWLAIIQMVLFMLVMTVVMARSTAEAGLLMTTLTFRPMDIVRLFVPLHAMGAANLTVTSFLDPIFFRDQRGLVLTAFMDGMKISDGVGMRRRSLLLIFSIAIVTAYLAASIIQIYLSYHRGAMTMYPYLTMDNPTMAFRSYTPALTGQVPFEATNIGFTIAGIITTLILITMRLNCFWWPLHPLGYALSSSWSLWVFWFPCLIAWAAKGLITHYGGMRFYLKARPFFLGLILGEFTLALFWTLITSITPCSAPEFPWP